MMIGEEKQEKKPRTREVFTFSISTEAQPPLVLNADDESDTPHDFEESIEATGFGLFNYLLLLAAVPGGFASLFDTTTMSYVLPAAECDLKLTLFQKGVLNAITYSGMISSAFMWGFLSDTMGRRSLLKYGYLADTICNVVCSMSQSFHFLVVFKFLTGFIIGGPYAIQMTYVAEFHDARHRPGALMFSGIAIALSSVAVPVLAWAIIPQSWSFTLFDGAFTYNSWRIFILASGIPAFFAYLMLLYFPESPKFLMSQGRNDEAMKIFQRIYSMNTGKPPETFPIKSLCQEGQKKQIERTASQRKLSLWGKTRNGFMQIKPLFLKPHIGKFLLVNTIQFGTIVSLNTVRLWIPQLFTTMENFVSDSRDPSLGDPTWCEMISISNTSKATVINDNVNGTMIHPCVTTPIPTRVYTNAIIIACAMVLANILAGSFVNLIGRRILLFTVYGIPAVCAAGLYWSPNSDSTLAILAIYLAFPNIAITAIISIIVELMPTSLRTTAVSMTMCAGRIGAVIGNLIFPILLNAGCMAPFIFVGGFLILCFVMSIFIPKPPVRLM